jgi:hypothetical protein
VFFSGAQVFLISSEKPAFGQAVDDEAASSWRNDTGSPSTRQRVSVRSSPCSLSGPAATSPLRSIRIRLMTSVLAGSRSNVRSTFLIQNGGGA